MVLFLVNIPGRPGRPFAPGNPSRPFGPGVPGKPAAPGKPIILLNIVRF